MNEIEMWPDLLYQLMMNEIDVEPGYDMKSDSHKEMVYKRCHDLELTSYLDQYHQKITMHHDLSQPLSVVELGCSFGFLSFAERFFSHYNFKSWIGYDIDEKGIVIANRIKDLYLPCTNECDCKFIHSATTNTNTDILYVEDSYPLGMNIYQPGKNPVPNTHFSQLPSADIYLVDIEGACIDLDLDQLDFKILMIETNTKSATSKFLKLILSRENTKYRCIHSHVICNNRDKSFYIFVRRDLDNNNNLFKPWRDNSA